MSLTKQRTAPQRSSVNYPGSTVPQVSLRYTSPPGNQCGSDLEIIMMEEQNTSRLNKWNNMGKGLVLFVIHFELIGLVWDPYTPKINTFLSVRTESQRGGGKESVCTCIRACVCMCVYCMHAITNSSVVGHYREKQRGFLILHKTEQFCRDRILQDKDYPYKRSRWLQPALRWN